MSLSETIYRHSPEALQHLLFSAYGYRWKWLRFGPGYQREVDGYRSRDRWSREQWHQWQNEQLRVVLRRALTRVPHYREAWSGLLSEQQIERFTIDDLSALPPLEKETLRSDPHSLLVDGRVQSGQRPYYTSGSSGTPLSIYMSPADLRRGMAVREVRSLGPAGVSYRQPRATFGVRVVVPDAEAPGAVHRYNHAERQIYFSAFHLAPRWVPRYLDALRRHDVRWITGYSHSIYLLAELALRAGLEPGRDIPRIDAVVTASEPVSAEMRQVLETAFQTKVFEEYGSVENTFMASENEFHQMLLSPDYGVFETVDADLRPVPVDEPGEVLTTGFAVEGQPLVRFRLGDLATLSGEPPRCGRNLPVVRDVIGRIEEVVYAPDGRRTLRFNGIFVAQPNVRAGQVVQWAPDRLTVRVIPTPTFGPGDARDLEHQVHQRLGNRMRVEVETVDDLERSASGKLRAVISHLSADEICRLEAASESTPGEP